MERFNSSFNGWIDKKDIIQMSEYLPEPKSSGGRMKVELDLSSYATKADLKSGAGVDTSGFPKKTDLKSILKFDFDELDIDKSKNVPSK